MTYVPYTFSHKGLHLAIICSGVTTGRQQLFPSGDSRKEPAVSSLTPIGRLAQTFSAYLSGRHLNHPQVQTRFARKVELASEPPLPVEADGELVGLTPLTMEVYPGVFQVAAEKMGAKQYT